MIATVRRNVAQGVERDGRAYTSPSFRLKQFRRMTTRYENRLTTTKRCWRWGE